MAMTSASARFVVTIDFCVGQWSGDAKFNDQYEQIKREGKQILESRMKDTGLSIVGEPKIKFVIFEQ